MGESLSTCGPSLCGPSFCEACERKSGRKNVDPSLAGVFCLRPLAGCDSEAEAATSRATRHLAKGAHDEALQELHDANQLAPRSHVACCNLGGAYFATGDDVTAIYWYRQAQRLNPRDDVATQGLAFMEQLQDQVPEADRLLKTFVRDVDPQHIGALRQLAKLYQGQYEHAKAAACYRRLSALQPGNVEWLQELQRCSDMAESDSGSEGEALACLQDARRLREAGKSEAALERYRQALTSEPGSLAALLGITECHCDLGNADGARQAGQRLLTLQPDGAEGQLRIAELLLRAGCAPSLAEPYLQQASADPSFARGRQHRLLCVAAELALAREDHVKAMRSAAEAVRIDASAPRGLVSLAMARIGVADYAKALRALAAALDACGQGGLEDRQTRATVHMLRAQAHERLRQYQDAFRELQRALELNPQMVAARVVRAVALQQSGRLQESEAELRAILQQHPSNAAARLQLGNLLMCKADARAVQELEAVVTGGSNSPSILGAARVYLSLALDTAEGGRGGGRATQMVLEGLQLHRNLNVVWKEIQNSAASDPRAAVQRLRGICDLDLTSLQAKQLLNLLARATGSMELTLSAGVVQGTQRRSGSIPPERWAPGGYGSRPGTPLSGPRSPGRWVAGGYGSGPGTPLGSCRVPVGYGSRPSSGQGTPLGGRSPCQDPWPNIPAGGLSRGRSVSPLHTANSVQLWGTATSGQRLR